MWSTSLFGLLPGQLGLMMPALLVSSAAILIPLAIHLFSQHKGKPVTFPHIGLIPAKTMRPSFTARITQWWLLLLRMLLVLVLSLLLAQLAWLPQANERSTSRKVIAVTAPWLGVAPEQQWQALSEKATAADIYLMKTGAESGWLPVGFAQLQQHREGSQAALTDDFPMPLWQALAQLLSATPPGTPVTLYSDDRLAQFLDTPVQSRGLIEWHLTSAPAASGADSGSLTTDLWLFYEPNWLLQAQRISVAVDLVNRRDGVQINLQLVPLVASVVDDEIAALSVTGAESQVWWLSDKALPAAISTADTPDTRTPTQAPLQGLLASTEQADFPLLLGQMLFESELRRRWLTSARVTQSQLQKLGQGDTAPLPATQRHRSLEDILGMLLLLLFVTERLLSEWAGRTAREKAQGQGA